MKERELEKIMYGFINGEIDVLVSTTIIETGLDISNVNTMIIHDSDQMDCHSSISSAAASDGRTGLPTHSDVPQKQDVEGSGGEASPCDP